MSATSEFHFCNFRHIFDRGVAWNYKFFTPRCFCSSENFKGTAARDFWPLFFCEPFPYDNNLGYESGIRSIQKKSEVKNLVQFYCCESCRIAEVTFWRSAIAVPQLFLVHNSTINLVVRNIAEVRTLNCRCPPLVFIRLKVALLNSIEWQW